MQRIPRITGILLIANVLIYLLQQLYADSMLAHFALWPIGHQEPAQLDNGTVVTLGFAPWQLITYGFLHGGISHIAFNMLALWMFGGPVEQTLGEVRYVIYYIACVIGAACAQLAVVHFFSPTDFYPTLGASGGVFGLLLAFAMLYPRAKIVMLYFPVPIAAPIAVVLYMILELFLGVTGTQAGVAHFAHLGGALVGFVLLMAWRSSWQQRR